MGEWSEYFEDFPEENPANQKQEPDLGVMSIVFPHLHLSQLTKAELAVENAKIEELKAVENAKIEELKAEAERLEMERANFIKEAKSKPMYQLDICPICYAEAMVIFKVSDDAFYCECHECKVSGDGSDISEIFEKMEDARWNVEM